MMPTFTAPEILTGIRVRAKRSLQIALRGDDARYEPTRGACGPPYQEGGADGSRRPASRRPRVESDGRGDRRGALGDDRAAGEQAPSAPRGGGVRPGGTKPAQLRAAHGPSLDPRARRRAAASKPFARAGNHDPARADPRRSELSHARGPRRGQSREDASTAEPGRAVAAPTLLLGFFPRLLATHLGRVLLQHS